MITSKKTVFIKKRIITKNHYFFISQRQVRHCVTLYENQQKIIELGYDLIVYGFSRINKLFFYLIFFKKTFILTDFNRYLNSQIMYFFLIYFPRYLKM